MGTTGAPIVTTAPSGLSIPKKKPPRETSAVVTKGAKPLVAAGDQR